MITHRRIWKAIDKIAEEKNISSSHLAKIAGLAPTSFNKSKRIANDGRERWPSTETLARILNATGETITEFATRLEINGEGKKINRNIPLIGLAQAGQNGLFDDAGFPLGGAWETINLPGTGENDYALEISGESMQPLYKEGDIIIVSPDENARRGDKVVVKTKNDEVMAKILKRKTNDSIELDSFNPKYQTIIKNMYEIVWIARITWASQ